MMRRRKRGRKPSWQWANSFTMNMTIETIGAPYYVTTWLVPPTRVSWLCDTSRVDHVTHERSLIWLDLTIQSDDTEVNTEALPLDFYIVRVTEDFLPTFSSEYVPFAPPATPASVTAWEVSSDDAEDSDGLDPYLWTHHLSPFVAGTVAGGINPGGGESGNATVILQASSPYPGGVIQPDVNVRAAWSPDVVVSSRRRLARGEGLLLGMRSLNNTPDGAILNSLSVNHRTLLR